MCVLLTRNSKKCLVVALTLFLVVYLFIITRVSVTQYNKDVSQVLSQTFTNSSFTPPSFQFPFLEKDLRGEQQLMYNRVPKCGSSTSSTLFKELSMHNHFKVFFILKEGYKNFNEEGQLNVIQRTRNVTQPWMYIQHVHMINFTDFGERMPVHINIVRDPIERLMSAYYYKRFKAPRPMSPTSRNMSFEDCVQKRFKECTNEKVIFVILPYFCGSRPDCLIPSNWVLQRAKRNVEKFYSLVGHVDELGKFYAVLEKTMPQYFKGLVSLYKQNLEKLKKSTSTKVKKTLSDSSRLYLRSLLGLEYEFYYFIRRRFKETYERLMHRS